MPIRYYISLKQPEKARGSDDAFSFTAHGAPEFAAQLQAALRSDGYFQRWKQTQSDPDAVDPGLGAIDPATTVTGEQHNLQIDLIVATTIPGSVLKHRLRLLAGNAWELRDVSAL